MKRSAPLNIELRDLDDNHMLTLDHGRTIYSERLDMDIPKESLSDSIRERLEAIHAGVTKLMQEGVDLLEPYKGKVEGFE